MKRGTTPIHEFTVDMDLTNAVVVYVTYNQGSQTVLEKTIEEMDITPEKISYRLTQKETLKFKSTLPVEIQIRCRMLDDTAYETDIINVKVDKLLKQGEI